MPATRLLFRDFAARGESHHFARLELGPANPRDLHRHDFSEFFWVEEGRGVHLAGGTAREVGAGDLVFVRPEEVHTVGAVGAGGRFLLSNLAFRTGSWQAIRRRHPGATAGWFRPGALSRRHRRVGTGVLHFLRRAGLELAASPRAPLLLERFLLNLAFVLDAEEKDAGLPGWLREAAERVERDRLFQRGGAELARAAGRSPAHVAREVRRLLGKTPTDWVNEMRMRHAARLLAGTRREILDVCAECGLENVGHFYALFRSQHGMTPLAYRYRSSLILRPAAG